MILHSSILGELHHQIAFPGRMILLGCPGTAILKFLEVLRGTLVRGHPQMITKREGGCSEASVVRERDQIPYFTKSGWRGHKIMIGEFQVHYC